LKVGDEKQEVPYACLYGRKRCHEKTTDPTRSRKRGRERRGEDGEKKNNSVFLCDVDSAQPRRGKEQNRRQSQKTSSRPILDTLRARQRQNTASTQMPKRSGPHGFRMLRRLRNQRERHPTQAVPLNFVIGFLAGENAPHKLAIPETSFPEDHGKLDQRPKAVVPVNFRCDSRKKCPAFRLNATGNGVP